VSSERGSVSLVAVAIIVMLMVIAMGAADVARVLAASARAQAAADAAALAAAQELAFPRGRQPADVAGDYAAANGATLEACECAVGSTEATVSVSVDAGPMLLVGGSRVVIARARAVVDDAGG